MNLEESDEFIEKMEKENKKKRNLIYVFIACVFLLILLIILMQYYKKIDEKTLKVYVNSQKYSFTSNFIKENNGEKYFNVKELCNVLGYTYHQGEYKSYTEDEDMCYVTNDYEISSFGKNSKYISKYLLNNSNSTEEEEEEESEEEDNEIDIVVKSQEEVEGKIKLNEDIIIENNTIYVSKEDAKNIFDIRINNENEYRIYLETPVELLQVYSKKLAGGNYKEISNYYENLMAISDDMLIVSNGEKWGVISLQTGNEIIGLKYDDIVYMKTSNEFIVKADNYEGIISVDGSAIIKPTLYESVTPMYDIIQYDNDKKTDSVCKLYLVNKNKKYGVVNNKNETIVFPEYTSIGLKNIDEFPEDNLKSTKILLESLIPVEYDGKYGLIDINGNERLKCIYDSLGYIVEEETTEKDSKNDDSEEDKEGTSKFDNLLLIPEEVGIKGIIVKKDGLYGIYDANAESLTVPCVFEKIYSKTKLSTKKYYFEYNGIENELENYLEENNLKNVQ